MPPKIVWYADLFLSDFEKIVAKRLIAIGMKVEAESKRSMRGYGQYSRLDLRETVKGSKRTKSGKRHYPSPPGSPPAVDTGRLRASISTAWTGAGFEKGGISYSNKTKINAAGEKVREKVSPANPKDGVSAPDFSLGKFTVVVGSAVEYASYLEYGTSKMLARPYLRPSLEKFRSEIVDALKGAI